MRIKMGRKKEKKEINTNPEMKRIGDTFKRAWVFSLGQGCARTAGIL